MGINRCAFRRKHKDQTRHKVDHKLKGSNGKQLKMLHRSNLSHLPRRSVILILALFPAALCDGQSALTTLPPLYSFTVQIAGDSLAVEMLEGITTHGGTLSPGELKKMAAADAVIFNGLGLEPWLEKFLRSTSSKIQPINASAGIEPIMHGNAPNPHVWLDPILAIKQVENIRDALSAIDRENAPHFRRNAQHLVTRLHQLHGEIERATSDLPHKRMITAHHSFDYFARRYAFDVVAVVQPVPER
jgi:zinc transport system substrate-binding protein